MNALQIAASGMSAQQMRVDVVAVKLPFTIHHLENAFME